MWDNLIEKIFKGRIMNNKQNWNNLGDQFKHAVSDAINKGDFKKLNYLVTDTVTDVIAEASCQIKKTTEEMKQEYRTTSRSDIYRNVKLYQRYQQQRQHSYKQTDSNSHIIQSHPIPISKVKQVGKVSSILYIVFGGIGTGFMILLLLIAFLCALVDWVWSVPMFITLFLGLIAFLLMIQRGVAERKRLTRAKRYISLCDDNMYVNIDYLARQTDKSVPYVLKDIKNMLKSGFFPEGHLDQTNTCLMLDDKTYHEYLRVEKERTTLAQEEAKKKEMPLSEEDKRKLELQSIMNEGQEHIEKLHHLNDVIEDEVVSEKLYQMEDLLKQIFARLEDAPEQMPKMRKLMNYYLPTTIKLLQAYSEFDDVNTPNNDITSAKAEIEKTIDIINEAFAELLNKLFQDSAFDAATDAQVLQTMLAKEGLTKNKIVEDL